MQLQSELAFLREALKKCRMQTSMLSENDKLSAALDSFLARIVGTRGTFSMTAREIDREGIKEGRKYQLVNEMDLRYLLMRLPLDEEKNLLFVGPYLTVALDEGEIMKIEERLGLSPGAHRFLVEYYSSLPIVSESDRIDLFIDTFLERVWPSLSINLVEIDLGDRESLSLAERVGRTDDFDETIANIERMERRYAFESEMMQAVKLGQRQKEATLLAALNDQIFEKRLQDTLRNAKNYCIIMNTLLRKAAEEGGVHPLYIDRASSSFAAKIESTVDMKAIFEVMREMFSSYCRLVRRHSTGRYSVVVKNTVLMIDADISAELSLSALAESQGVTAGYLATVFKKETGRTVVSYIRERRISRAKHLLETTDLQVQTVAMHSGITDVQYFSRIFKKETGKTPKEYRQSVRR